MKNAEANVGLAASVLVLNRFYMAVHVVNARRAFCLLFRELAEVIDLEDGQFANYDFSSWRLVSEMRCDRRRPDQDWVHTVSFEIEVPRVVRLLAYDRVPKRNVRFNRRNVFARDGHACQYCGDNLPPHQLSFDHVVPRSRGGKTTWENIVSCCMNCNSKKGGRTPQEARMKLISKPSKPRHSPLLSMKLGQPKYQVWRTFVKTPAGAVDVA